MSPWYNGYVPPDGYRMYIHGTNYKIKFQPCGHEFETFDYENLGIGKPHCELKHYIKDMVERRMKGEVVKCEYCDAMESDYWYEVKTSEIPERQFKAYRIMGWA